MVLNRLSRPIARLKNTLVALLFVGTQLVAPLAGAGIFMGHAAAAATTNCVTDTAGANDVPGQKDLTKLCVDYSGAPTSIETTWNWDDTGTSGGNTLDACNLFDTNGNGNADTAVCVTTTGDPASLQSTTTYTCGDSRADRCTNSVLISTITTGTNFCNVSQQSTNPFDSSVDTQGDCTVPLASVGGAAAKLIDVCSYPSSQPNSDPSDCVISQPKAGKLEVVKHLVPTSDSGKFNLQIDGTTKAANVSNNGTTGVVVLPTGNHGVAETAGTSTTLTNYDSAISCRDLDGTGSVVASGTGTSLASVPLAEGSDVVCVITNTLKQATLILQKTVINDNGGTLQQSDFPVAIGANTASWGSNTVSPGTYSVSETQQTGYQAGSWGGDCSTAGSVTIAPGETKTCSITNNDIAPQLTVIKHVVNDNGGTATAGVFTMNVTGTNVSSASFGGAESPGTTVTLNAGSYSVGEGSHNGYAESASSDCSGTIAIGAHKTCTITNDDIAPLLTLVKHVTNDNGGTAAPTDWTLSATPGSGTALSGSGGFSGQTARANTTYTLAEAGGPSGYSASSWNCNGGTLANSTNLTLNLGDDVTCDITNNDIAPQLTVTKVVTNDDGGQLGVANFPLFVSGVQVTSGATNIFNAGAYTISETQQPGYNLDSIAGNCLSDGSITLAIGGIYNCTLTNNDIPATITVTKTVVNDNGGTASVSDFKLLVGSTQVTSGVSNTFAANQSYTVSEQALVDGYAQTSLSCEDSTTHVALGATFTPANGQQISCLIVNNDIAPQLTVIKHVVNDNGGGAQASDFTMNVSGTDVSNSSFAGAESPGTTVTLKAGTYGVDEAAHNGYTKTLGANCSGTIAIGEQKTCVVTNDDQPATLTLIKHIINDNGGNETASDFQAYVDNTAVNWGDATSLNAASYTVSEHELPGWTASDWSGDCAADGTITLTPGQDKTCEITNNDVPPSLTIVKNVTNDNGGDVPATAFTVRVNGDSLSGAVASNNDQTATYQYADPLANTSYSVSEDSTSGYTQTGLTCTDNDTQASVTQPVVLNEGQHVTCVIANDDQAPHLSLQKYVSNKHGGTAQATDWTLSATPADATFATISGSGSASGSAQANQVYTLSESNGPDGYADSGWVCDAGDVTGNHLTLSPGVSASCSITNSDVAPTLTLVKHVTNDNGGNKTADQWTLTAQHSSDTPVINEQGTASHNGTVATTTQTMANANTTYDLSEDGPAGYSSASGWSCDGGTLNGSTLTLALATDVTCTITNDDQPASIKLIKEIINDNTNSVHPDDFHLTIDGNQALSGHSYDVTSNEQHTIGEGTRNDYKFVQVIGQTEADTAACQAANASMLLFGTGNLPPLSEGQHVTCIITNTKLTTIRINKVTQFADGTTTNDPQDFHFTTEGAGLSDFSLDTDPGDATLSDNQVFDNLTPGQDEGGYHISEDAVTGWQLDHISCGDTEVQTTQDGVFIFPVLGQDVVCNFVNTKQPVVSITKTNNRPQPTVVNDTVTYTMTVSVPNADQAGGAPIYNTVVTDLPPSQFVYVPGSWTATTNMSDHNVSADIIDGSPTGQPSYGSPGLWHLGTLQPGEVITLTYKAKIDTSVADGTYKDLAFVKGNPAPLSSTVVLGNLSFASTPFVATTVSVLSPAVVPQVLGAEVLVNTGTNIVAAQYVLPILLIAGVSVTRRTTHYKEKAGK